MGISLQLSITRIKSCKSCVPFFVLLIDIYYLENRFRRRGFGGRVGAGPISAAYFSAEEAVLSPESSLSTPLSQPELAQGLPIHPPPKTLSKPHHPPHHHHHHQNARASRFASTCTVILPAINVPLDAVS